MKISYHQNNRSVQKNDATLSEIVDIIASLNATDSIFIHVLKGEIDLSVISGHPKRRIVILDKLGRLLDPAYTETDGKVRMRVDDGTFDTHPINQTVTREKAIEVARYILEHDAPPQGLTWLAAW